MSTDADRLFQVYEADLAELERTLPRLLDATHPHLDNQQRTQWRRVQQIIVNIRWNYGPPSEVEVIYG